jgi:hypothetical protein
MLYMKKQMIQLAAIGAIMLCFTQVSAATKQTFGGALCESSYNVNSTYGESVDYHFGSIYNNSNSVWGYIHCPVPRANGYSSGSVADLEVSVTDTDGNMWCSAYVRNRYGAVIGSETVNSSGTGNRILDFGSVAGGAPYEGYLDIFCVLPRNGGALHSIAVDFN